MERLRGQLRDTAQYGQRDEFGGDTLEDTAMGGFRRGTQGVERLLKGRKQGQKKRSSKHKITPAPRQMPPLLGKSGGPDRCGSRPVRLFWNGQRRSVVLELSAQGPAQRRSGLEQECWDQRGPWNHAPVLPRTPRSHPRRGADKRRRNRSGNALKRIADSPRVPHIPLPRLPRRIVGPYPQSVVQVNNTPPNKGDVAQPWLPLKHPDVQAVE